MLFISLIFDVTNFLKSNDSNEPQLKNIPSIYSTNEVSKSFKNNDFNEPQL